MTVRPLPPSVSRSPGQDQRLLVKRAPCLFPTIQSARDPCPAVSLEPTSPDFSAATSEGWSRDVVAPAACSLRVPVQTHAGPGAHQQPCLWIPDKAQRTDSRVDSMDRGMLPLAIFLLLAIYSLVPTSKCPAFLAWGHSLV